MDNKCVRCGKNRVLVKTYKKKVGNSVVTYKETACPDPKCQKIVEKKIQKEHLKRMKIKRNQEKREAERKSRLKQKRATK